MQSESRKIQPIQKLYRVKLRGRLNSYGSVDYGLSYVVASSMDSAYNLVRASLEAEDIGFAKERELESIELLAEKTSYPNCNTRLYVEGESL